VITDRVVVQDGARRPSVDDTARVCAWHDAPNCRAYALSGATEDGGDARRRSLRWIELGWEGATTAAREEARKEAVRDAPGVARARGGAPEGARGRGTDAPRGSETMKMPGHSAWYLVGTVRAAASGRSFVAAERHGSAAQVWLVLVVVCSWGAA
jgi:hypothetical protein